MQLQAIVDQRKWLFDIFVGMPRSMTNARMLHLSPTYHKATLGNVFHEQNSHEWIKPYMIGDKGYLLLPWLMVLQKQIESDIIC
jgi:hypothetical protein